jgi:PKD repeat protein
MGDMSDPFYGVYTVVDVAGFPHPESPMCPWHNKGYAVPLPHITEPVMYTAPTLAPVALFTYTPSEPVQREEITFNASMSYSPVNKTIISYAWDFGDDSAVVVESDPITTHSYTDSGNYIVTLIVTDEDYVNSSAFADSVYVAPWPSPIAIFTYLHTMPVECENIVFNASLSYSPQGAEIIGYAWNFGDGTTGTGKIITHRYLSAGFYEVTLTVTDAFGFNGSTVGSVFVNRGLMTLDVEADVGSIHFTGEVAQFHALVKFIGEPTNATKISAKLYGPNGQIVAYYLYPTNITILSTGLYKVSYIVGAAEGTYTLVVEAEYYTLKASTLRSFLVSVTLTGWNAMIKDINDEIATIVIPSIGEIKLNLTQIKAMLVSVEGTVGVIDTNVGQIKTNLALINATLTDIIVDSKGEILAKIDTALGTVTTKLDTINAKVIAIDGNVVTIKTSVGDVQTTLEGLQSTVTIGLAAASILSAVAAILAAIILLMLRKK